jgi:polysaccharide pyruvyl transferase CsaB
MGARILVAGYFGCGNLGDDAILLGFLQGLQGRNVDVIVMSGFPEETHRLYGVRCIPRKESGMFNEAIQECDALVFAGGSIFQDVTSVASVNYYSGLVSKAKKAGKKVIMLGQGIGPLNNFLGKRMATSAFNSADVIAVRDAASVQTLKSLGVKTTPRVCGDLAFLLPVPAQQEESGGYSVGNMKTIGIAPRPFGKHKEVVQLFGDLCRLLYQNNMMPVLIEMDHESDRQLLDDIEKSQGGKVPSIRKITTPMQLQQRLARMECVIAVRLHAGILASTVGVLPFMVSYDPKVSAFAASMNLPAPPGLTGMTANRLFETFMGFYKDRERHLATIERRREEMVKLAQANINLLMDFVKV